MTANNLLQLSVALAAADPIQPRGQRVHALLVPFLEAADHTAVAVIHGRGNSAQKAFRRASERLFERRALIWFDEDPRFDELDGPRAADLAAAFAEDESKVVTFYATLTRRTNWGLTSNRLLSGHIDGAFLAAELDR